MKEDSNATVYRSHTTEGALSQTISSSTQQVIRGDYTADASFRFWWNAPSGLTSSFVRIDVGILNTGTKTVCVNGQNLSPGCEYSIIYSQAVLEAVGARAPDFSEQPSYGGGITWTLTCGCCP